MWHYKIKVIKVIDGDTIKAQIDLGCNVHMVENLRLLGINTPEIRGPERSQGLVSKAALIELLAGRNLTARTIKDKKGKYGRYLASIYIDEGTENQIFVNDWLVENGYGEHKDY